MIGINEYFELKEARWSRKNRIRGGKIQRRKKVANDAAFKTSGSSVVRMKGSERRKRRISQKKAARKRKATASKAKRKRKIVLRKRKTLGFDKK